MKNRFQAFAFKCSLYRYSMVPPGQIVRMSQARAAARSAAAAGAKAYASAAAASASAAGATRAADAALGGGCTAVESR
jgi:hypothetical protein